MTQDGTATTQEKRFGPFVTFVIRKRPDGMIARWESRSHRKHLSDGPPRGSTWWAPQDRDWWIGVLFAVGSFLFGLGTVPAYVDAVGGRPDAATFFTGSLFFTSAGFLQYREAVDAAPERPGKARRKVFVFLPRQIDWLATGVQLVGTLEFNISTFAAIWAATGTSAARHHVWRPDVLGSVCFLVASALAWFEACHGWAAWRPRYLAWWITGVNLAGSVAFGFSAVASYVVPGTTQLLNVPVANLGTFVGAVCFFAGAVLLLFERTEPTPGVSPSPPRLTGPAPVQSLQAAGPVLAGQVLSEAGAGSIVRGVEGTVLPTCQKYGMGVIAWSPLAGGWLTGRIRRDTGVDMTSLRARRLPLRFDPSLPGNVAKLAAVEELIKIAADAGCSPTHLALAFVTGHPAVTSAIIGPRTMDQLTDLLAGASVTPDDDVFDRIDQIVPPGATLNPADAGWQPPVFADPTARRRPEAARAAS